MFSIGQFSRITGLTVKTIRLYHDKAVLKPAWIDEETGYRYFDQTDVERARAIRHLRDLDFPLGHVQEKGWTATLPYREIYLKGPGMIFKGNPRNYLTEIQILVEDRAESSTQR